MPIWVQNISYIASIVGVVLTVFLLILTKSLRKAYRNKARVPELVGDIKGAMHQLIEALGNWPTGKIDAIDAASTILAKINNMNDKLKQPEKDISRQIQDIYQKKAFFKRKTNVLHSLTKEDFRKSYTLLNQLITQVQDSLLDSDWK